MLRGGACNTQFPTVEKRQLVTLRELSLRGFDRFLPGDAELIALEAAADGGQDGGTASLTGPLIITSSESVPKND